MSEIESRARAMLTIHYRAWMRYGDGFERYRAKSLVWIISGVESPYRILPR